MNSEVLANNVFWASVGALIGSIYGTLLTHYLMKNFAKSEQGEQKRIYEAAVQEWEEGFTTKSQYETYHEEQMDALFWLPEREDHYFEYGTD